jgi:hypothetical protein
MAEKWVSGAIRHKGALTSYAKKMGKMKEDGTIDKEWIAKLSAGSGVWAKRARLAQTLNKLRG